MVNCINIEDLPIACIKLVLLIFISKNYNNNKILGLVRGNYIPSRPPQVLNSFPKVDRLFTDLFLRSVFGTRRVSTVVRVLAPHSWGRRFESRSNKCWLDKNLTQNQHLINDPI